MPKFLIQASYTADGAKGLLKEGGTGRRAAVEHVVNQLGGKVEAMYYAFGADDLYTIIDFPEATSMAAVALTVKASGGLNTRAVPLLEPEDIDEAARKTVEFRPPGG